MGEGGTLVPIRDYKDNKQIENFINDKKIFINKSKNVFKSKIVDVFNRKKYLELIDSFIYEK